MVSKAEPIARWLATVAAALVCAFAFILEPFGCAVGEYEEDKHCDPSLLAGFGLAALLFGIAGHRLTGRRAFHWTGIAAAVLLSLAGVN